MPRQIKAVRGSAVLDPNSSLPTFPEGKGDVKVEDSKKPKKKKPLKKGTPEHQKMLDIKQEQLKNTFKGASRF